MVFISQLISVTCEFVTNIHLTFAIFTRPNHSHGKVQLRRGDIDSVYNGQKLCFSIRSNIN